ncbi:hypothetical protein TWF718_005870 [Orbilia javanica]|uniref:Uncharacterized protein n=1 Tax=Orbilia javanica TaxID=47235 RepID=A0AAN8NXP0_9PEZI
MHSNSYKGVWGAAGSILRAVAIITTSFIHASPTQAQTANATTTTIYKTVENTHTITSLLDLCGTGLPQCNQIVWSTLVSNTSTPTSSSTISTPAATSISAPTGGFVLEEILGSLYFQFDDDTGRTVLALPGKARLVSLSLVEDVETLLQNSRNPSEIVFARYNASANAANKALGQEPARVLSVLREIRHTADIENDLISSDFVGDWVWNTTNGQVELHSQGRRWVIYKVAEVADSQILRRQGFTERAGSYNLYLLPADFQPKEDGPLQQAQLTANADERYATSYFSSITTTSSSSIGPSTIIVPASSLDSSSSHSSSGFETTQTSSSSTVPDAYDIITSLSLQGYCSSILSYTSPIATTTSVSTSITTDFYASFTEPSSTSMVTTETSGETSITSFISAAVETRRRDIAASKRSPEDDLSSYPSSSILSACSKAVTSPTGTIIETISSSEISVASEVTLSTTLLGVANGTATTTIPIVTETIPAIGAYKFVYNDPSDHSGTYYGQYITGEQIGPSYMKPSTDRPTVNWSPYYFEAVDSYGLSREYRIGALVLTTGLFWDAAGSDDAQSSVGDYAVREDLITSPLTQHPIYFKINSTTSVFTPDDSKNPVSNGVFWVCSTPGYIPLYFADPAIFTTLFDYQSAIVDDGCVNTGLSALQGGY